MGGRGARDGQGQGRDIGGHAGRLDQRVVGSVGTRDREARDRDGLTRAHVLVREHAGTARRHQAHGIAGDRGDGAARDGRSEQLVVSLVRGRGAGDRQG